MAKKFKGFKSSAVIKQQCEEYGWFYSQENYDAGSDYITFEFHSGKQKFMILYSTVNGRFMIQDAKKKKIITEESAELDNVKWYSELLDFIYTT